MQKLCFLLLILGLGCTSSEAPKVPQTTELLIDVDNPQILYMSDFFDSIDYIELVTPPDKPVGNIFKIIQKGEYYFLFDRSRKSVWVFDKAGFYVNEVLIPDGRGPNEVEHLVDVYISDSLNIHALGQYKIVVFDIEGEAVNQVTMNFNPFYIFYDEEMNRYGGYVTSMLNVNIPEGYKMYNLFYFNSEGEIVGVDSKIRKGAEGIKYIIPNYFTEFGGSVHFSPHINDTLYRYEGGSFEPLYTFNFGEYQITQEVLNKRDTYSTVIWDWQSFWGEEIGGNGLISSVSFYEETEQLLLLSAGNQISYSIVVYDKVNNELFVGSDRFVNDIDYGPSAFMYSSSDTEYFTYFESSTFFNKIRELETSSNDFNENTLKMVEQSKQMSNTGNPILVVYHPKARLGKN